MGILRSSLHSDQNHPLQQIRNRVPELIYKLRDDFLTPRLPGAVNGTSAEPGPGTRTVVDTLNLMDIGRGSLSVHGANAAGDPGIWYDAQTREAGLMLLGDLQIADVTQICEVGFDANQAGALTINAYRISADTLLIYDSGALGPSVYIPLDGTDYKYAIILRATGTYYFWHDGSAWELLWISDTNNTATVYPGISNNSVLSGSFGEMAIPSKLWLPDPLLSDDFLLSNVPAIIDYGGVNNGDSTIVGFGGDANGAVFDDMQSYVDIYSAAVNSRFVGTECSLVIRGKLPAAVWTDATVRQAIMFQVDANNQIYIGRPLGNNQLEFGYFAGGVNTAINDATLAGSTNWFTAGVTGSDSNNQLRGYINGAEIAASPVANAGVFVGNLSANNTVIGASSTVPANVWKGWLKDAICTYHGSVITPAQMATIHTMLDAGTMTESWLNSTFGPGAWSWWKMNESFTSDGEGHAEGVAGGIGSGGEELLYEQPVGGWAQHFADDRWSCINGDNIMVADVKTADVIVTAEINRFGDTGITLRYTDENNYIRAVIGAVNCQLIEVVGGVPNTLITAAAAAGVNFPIRAILDGTSARLYYNDVLIGSTAIIDATLTGTKHGIYGSRDFSRAGSLTIYARGTDGEYALLEDF